MKNRILIILVGLIATLSLSAQTIKVYKNSETTPVATYSNSAVTKYEVRAQYGNTLEVYKNSETIATAIYMNTADTKYRVVIDNPKGEANLVAAFESFEGNNLTWASGDKIKIFNGTNTTPKEVIVKDGFDTTDGAFQGPLSIASDCYVLYPTGTTTSVFNDGVVSNISLPSVQTATLNSPDKNAVLMMGKINGQDKTVLKNVLAYIKVTIEEPAKKILFSSYNAEDIAGTVSLNYNSGTPTATVTANGTHTVSLIPADGETTIAAGTYYIAILPQSLPFGYVLSYIDASDITHNLISNDAYTSVRNDVTDMGTINASNTYTNRQIVYYASSKFDFSSNSAYNVKVNNSIDLKYNVSQYTHTFSDGVGILTFNDDVWQITNCLGFGNTNPNITKIILPETLTSLSGGSYSFYNSNIKELYLPKSITAPYTDLILGMPQLEKLLLPKNIAIKQGMITNCPKLKYIYGPYTTTEHDAIIKDNVLITVAGGGKTSYTVPEGVTKIGISAFLGTTISGTITIPKGVTSIADRAFQQSRQLKNVVFEEGSTITSIPTQCFYWSGARVEIPNSVTKIEQAAFYAYNNYQANTKTDIVIPDNVTTIGKNAFFQSRNIESIRLGAKVSSVGDGAFGNISNLKHIYSKNPTPPTLHANAFQYNSMSGVVIHVPTESVDAYKAASVWSTYADQIEGYDFE